MNQVNNKPFVDPDLPAGYSPFNIQILSGGKLYVMYAKKDATGKKDIGPGNGYINIFNPNGILLKRFASKGKLNAPWGITIAPAGFWGEFSQTQITNVILVGNNGDGHINAFDENGNFIGPLYTKGKAIKIDGLWGLTFPPITGLNRYYLYFASGPDNGTNGLVGYIKNSIFKLTN
ncbi:MAG TPA: TIGR03118 family protein [Chitinophagaceae bacterium]|nr:TIGR03118 family protein [Chitinophagaceae bacterium]